MRLFWQQMTSDIILKATGEMSAAANDPSKGQKLLISKKPLRESQGKFQKLKFHTPIFLAYFFFLWKRKKVEVYIFQTLKWGAVPFTPWEYKNCRSYSVRAENQFYTRVWKARFSRPDEKSDSSTSEENCSSEIWRICRSRAGQVWLSEDFW